MEMIQNFVDWVLGHFDVEGTCDTFYNSQNKNAAICKIITKISQFYDILEKKLYHMFQREEVEDYLITCKGTANGIEYLVFLRTDY